MDKKRIKLEIKLAAEMGFCFGVKRAIKLAEKAAKELDSLESLGPIVHNQQVVDRLASQGIRTVDSLEDVKGNALLIPSHGVGKQVMEQISASGLKVIDATCPIVRKAQRVARKLSQDGFRVLVFGDAFHPEVKAVLSWAGEKALATVEVPEFDFQSHRIGILSQTTQSQRHFANFLAQFMSSKLASLSELRIFNTICNATSKRQQAALELAAKVDLMLVIGGRNSANTKRLAEICASTGVTTFHIETAAELNQAWFQGVNCVGITAGASTPDWVIKEVIETLTEY